MDASSIAMQFTEWGNEIILSLGYLGIFIVSFVGSASIILPIPAFFIIPLAVGLGLNPWIVGVLAGIGSAFGEATGYALGKGGGKVIEMKYKKHVEKYSKWFEGKKAFFAVLFFAATPLPDDILGIVCGIFRYDFKKFMLASIIGKVLLNTFIALGFFYGIEFVSEFIGW